MLQRRAPLRRRTPLRARSRRSAYSRRERDIAFMLWVKGRLCSVEEDRPDPDRDPTPCCGPVEADHMGARVVGRKADDTTCAPLCRSHHRERSDHSGSFRHLNRDQLRAWRSRQIARTRTLWEEHQR
jgi:hypothetical protein